MKKKFKSLSKNLQDFVVPEAGAAKKLPLSKVMKSGKSPV